VRVQVVQDHGELERRWIVDIQQLPAAPTGVWYVVGWLSHGTNSTTARTVHTGCPPLCVRIRHPLAFADEVSRGGGLQLQRSPGDRRLKEHLVLIPEGRYTS
jgi:hypothetical protein